MARADSVVGGTPITGNTGKGTRGISNIEGGVKDTNFRKPPKDSGYPGAMDTRPQESDITKSAKD